MSASSLPTWDDAALDEKRNSVDPPTASLSWKELNVQPLAFTESIEPQNTPLFSTLYADAPRPMEGNDSRSFPGSNRQQGEWVTAESPSLGDTVSGIPPPSGVSELSSSPGLRGSERRQRHHYSKEYHQWSGQLGDRRDAEPTGVEAVLLQPELTTDALTRESPQHRCGAEHDSSPSLVVRPVSSPASWSTEAMRSDEGCRARYYTKDRRGQSPPAKRWRLYCFRNAFVIEPNVAYAGIRYHAALLNVGFESRRLRSTVAQAGAPRSGSPRGYYQIKDDQSSTRLQKQPPQLVIFRNQERIVEMPNAKHDLYSEFGTLDQLFVIDGLLGCLQIEDVKFLVVVAEGEAVAGFNRGSFVSQVPNEEVNDALKLRPSSHSEFFCGRTSENSPEDTDASVELDSFVYRIRRACLIPFHLALDRRLRSYLCVDRKPSRTPGSAGPDGGSYSSNSSRTPSVFDATRDITATLTPGGGPSGDTPCSKWDRMAGGSRLKVTDNVGRREAVSDYGTPHGSEGTPRCLTPSSGDPTSTLGRTTTTTTTFPERGNVTPFPAENSDSPGSNLRGITEVKSFERAERGECKRAKPSPQLAIWPMVYYEGGFGSPTLLGLLGEKLWTYKQNVEKLLATSFYYSYEFEITHTLQRKRRLGITFESQGWPCQYSASQTQYIVDDSIYRSSECMSGNHSREKSALSFMEVADRRFLWNSRISQAFRAAKVDLRWLVPIMQGSVTSATVTGGIYGLDIILIGRRSWQRAGTRYNHRGIDDAGNVANFTESEQLLALSRVSPYTGRIVKRGSNIAGGGWMSFVQIRGSVPLFWEQTGSIPLNAVPQLTREPSFALNAFLKHQNELLHLYGSVCYVNLLSSLKSGEQKLSQAFESLAKSCIETSSTKATYAQPGNGGAQNSLQRGSTVTHVAWDFHQEVKLYGFEAALARFMRVLWPQMQPFGYYSERSQYTGHETYSEQTGVLRTNCLDCLDRTNVLQWYISWSWVFRFLMDRGLKFFCGPGLRIAIDASRRRGTRASDLGSASDNNVRVSSPSEGSGTRYETKKETMNSSFPFLDSIASFSTSSRSLAPFAAQREENGQSYIPSSMETARRPSENVLSSVVREATSVLPTIDSSVFSKHPSISREGISRQSLPLTATQADYRGGLQWVTNRNVAASQKMLLVYYYGGDESPVVIRIYRCGMSDGVESGDNAGLMLFNANRNSAEFFEEKIPQAAYPRNLFQGSQALQDIPENSATRETSGALSVPGISGSRRGSTSSIWQSSIRTELPNEQREWRYRENNSTDDLRNDTLVADTGFRITRGIHADVRGTPSTPSTAIYSGDVARSHTSNVMKEIVARMWADHGDHISRAYTGTDSVMSSLIRQGKASLYTNVGHVFTSVGRLIKNTFEDSSRQDAIEILLHEHSQLSPEDPEPKKRGFYQIPSEAATAALATPLANIPDSSSAVETLSSAGLRGVGNRWHASSAEAFHKEDGVSKVSSLTPHSHGRELIIWTGSWNMCGNRATAEALGRWLFVSRSEGAIAQGAPHLAQKESPDLYVIGVQELVGLSKIRVLLSQSDRDREELFEQQIQNLLGAEYKKLKSHSLVGLYIVIFTKASLKHMISHVQATEVKLGFKRQMGNKGAVLLRLMIGGVSFCFVNVHLVSGVQKSAQRRSQLQTVLDTTFPTRPSYKTSEHDCVFIAGDFNFRCDVELGEAESWLSEGQWKELLSRDQYIVGKRSALFPFSELHEGSVHFPPTYKFICGTHQLDGARIPGWCDRIFYTGACTQNHLRRLELTCHQYNWASDVYNSDHRPVYAVFSVRIKEDICVTAQESYTILPTDVDKHPQRDKVQEQDLLNLSGRQDSQTDCQGTSRQSLYNFFNAWNSGNEQNTLYSVAPDVPAVPCSGADSTAETIRDADGLFGSVSPGVTQLDLVQPKRHSVSNKNLDLLADIEEVFGSQTTTRPSSMGTSFAAATGYGGVLRTSSNPSYIDLLDSAPFEASPTYFSSQDNGSVEDEKSYGTKPVPVSNQDLVVSAMSHQRR